MFLRVNEGRHKLVIKKSEFVSLSKRIDSRDAALDAVGKIRAEFPDATHVCYGYIADENGNDFGYDDDKEPSGTAGKPIYSALDAARARRSLIAVVRYFGGIKLGSGGLTRAYRQAASELIENAGLTRCERLARYCVECDGETFKKVRAVLVGADCEIVQIVYNALVSFTAIAPADTDVGVLVAPLGVTPIFTGYTYYDIEE